MSWRRFWYLWAVWSLAGSIFVAIPVGWTLGTLASTGGPGYSSVPGPTPDREPPPVLTTTVPPALPVAPPEPARTVPVPAPRITVSERPEAPPVVTTTPPTATTTPPPTTTPEATPTEDPAPCVEVGLDVDTGGPYLAGTIKACPTTTSSPTAAPRSDAPAALPE